MRKRYSSLNNSKLFTADHLGMRPFGRVTDLLLEYKSWNVRYVVVSTEESLDRKVLISTAAIYGFDFNNKSISTTLTRDQVAQSPPLDSDQPISRQYEQVLVDYFGWPIYWLGRNEIKPLLSGSAAADEPAVATDHIKWSNLRSAKELCGYQILSRNGPAGTMKDLIIDMDSWTIDYATADSASWLPKDSSMLSTCQISQVDWSNRRLMVDLSKKIHKAAPRTNDRPVVIGEPVSSHSFRIV